MVKSPVREGVTRLFSLFDESLFDFFSRDSFDFEPARFGVCEMTVRKSRLSYDSSAYQDLYFFRDITYVKSLEEKISRQAKTQGFTARYQIQDILYQSDSMRRCLESVRIFSPGNKTILLGGGERNRQGTDCQSIHRLSVAACSPSWRSTVRLSMKTFWKASLSAMCAGPSPGPAGTENRDCLSRQIRELSFSTKSGICL